MPNHIHLLVYIQEQSKGLNHVIGEAKCFLAYEIVSRLNQKKETELLEKLAAVVQKKDMYQKHIVQTGDIHYLPLHNEKIRSISTEN